MYDFKTCAVDKYKDKSPNYSLSMRYSAPGDKTGKPGPGAYMSEKVFLCFRDENDDSKLFRSTRKGQTLNTVSE